MAERGWKRSDVDVGDVFTTDDLDAEPLLWKVQSIADEPTLTLVPLFERDGEDEAHYVISSPLFAKFHKVETRPPS